MKINNVLKNRTFLKNIGPFLSGRLLPHTGYQLGLCLHPISIVNNNYRQLILAQQDIFCLKRLHSSSHKRTTQSTVPFFGRGLYLMNSLTHGCSGVRSARARPAYPNTNKTLFPRRTTSPRCRATVLLFTGCPLTNVSPPRSLR